MKIMKSFAAVGLAALMLAGCSGLAGRRSVQAVRVLNPADVKRCRLMGHTTVSLVDELDTEGNDPAKIRQALDLLARRSAVTLGGDAVVAVGAVQAGQQAFDIYRCGER